MSLDRVQAAFYDLAFENYYLKLKGEAFQDFFASIMEAKYPSDFIRSRPWGKLGDRKNDGYVKSTKSLYQVYAPNELTAENAVAKIDEDFTAALPYWKTHLNNWTFVHNSQIGLGPTVTKKLLEIETNNTPLTVSHIGHQELKDILMSLPLEKIQSILGYAPSQADVSNVGFEKIGVVLQTIGRKQPSASANIKPVPSTKLSHNQLSASVEILLKAGMRKSDLVADFFAKWPDPSLGDQVASAFSERYAALKSVGLAPDLIFSELQSFAGGRNRGDAEHEASVLAVLAHLFEECDIFEDPDNNTGGTK